MAFSCFQSLPSFSNGWKSSLSALSLSIRARRASDHGWNPCETTRFWLSIPKNLQVSLVPILLRQSMAISYFQPDPRWSKGGVGQTFPMIKVAFKYPMIFPWYSERGYPQSSRSRPVAAPVSASVPWSRNFFSSVSPMGPMTHMPSSHSQANFWGHFALTYPGFPWTFEGKFPSGCVWK